MCDGDGSEVGDNVIDEPVCAARRRESRTRVLAVRDLVTTCTCALLPSFLPVFLWLGGSETNTGALLILPELIAVEFSANGVAVQSADCLHLLSENF